MNWTSYCTAGMETEPDSDRGNDSSSVNASQVATVVRDRRVTVGFPTNEPLSGKGMALGSGTARLVVSFTQMETIPNQSWNNLSRIFIKNRNSLKLL